MAYDHFWYRPLELDALRFSVMVADIRTLMNHLPISHKNLVLFGPFGLGEPIFTEELVNFCGDDGYAHFEFPRVLEVQELQRARARERADGLYFQDCRTGGIGHRVQQDFFVCACLLVIQHHFPEILLRSNGGYCDWYEAIQWYETTFKRLMTWSMDES